ncbi:MAG: Calx-beta domain-containing protein [Chloroflexota bacterium]
MNTNSPLTRKASPKNPAEQAQTLTEFALILPLLLFIIFGMVEFGRLLATYSMVTTASRNAARYGAAAGNVGGGVPHYLDCAGIREAAKKGAILSPITDENITITYDSGPGTPVISATCPATVPVRLGMRIQIGVAATFQPIVPLGGLLQTMTLRSSTVRTILTNVEIEGTPAPGGGNPIVEFNLDTTGGAVTANEPIGNYTNLQVTISVPSSSEVYVPFSVSGSATYGADFSIACDNNCSGEGRFHIPAGQQSAQVNIAINNDSLDENDETIVITLSKPDNANLGSKNPFTLIILDDDAGPNVRFMSQQQTWNENGGTLGASVGLTAVSGKEVVVPFYVTDGSPPATNGVDYNLVSGSVTIPAGSLEASLFVQVVDDTLDEDSEAFTLHIGDPVNAVRSAPDYQDITITDNDDPPVVSFALAEQTAGEALGTVNVTVNLSAATSRAVSVPFAITGSAESGGVDFTQTPNDTLVVPAGAVSADIVVTLVNDGIIETTNGQPGETVIFTMGTPTNATKGSPSIHTLTIADGVSQPKVSFAAATGTSQLESSGTLPVAVQLSNLWTQDVTVSFAVDGRSTATAGQDYTLPGSSVIIPAGELTANIDIALINDTLDETDIETVVLNLSGATNATLGDLIQHTAQIADDDSMPVVNIHINPSYQASGSESLATVLVDVELTNPSSNVVVVHFTAGGTATSGVDYTHTPNNMISIPAGSLKSQITLTVIDDNIYGEPNETVSFTMSSAVNATLGTATATYTIEENDLCPSLGTMPIPTDSQLDITVSNPSNIAVKIESIVISWYDIPTEQTLKTVYLGNNRIWQTDVGNSPATLSGSWKGTANDRTIGSGLVKMLSFLFSKSPLQTSASDYVTVTFNNGCTVSTSRTH